MRANIERLLEPKSKVVAIEKKFEDVAVLGKIMLKRILRT